jgi:hypothetical protein
MPRPTVKRHTPSDEALVIPFIVERLLTVPVSRADARLADPQARRRVMTRRA